MSSVSLPWLDRCLSVILGTGWPRQKRCLIVGALIYVGLRDDIVFGR